MKAFYLLLLVSILPATAVYSQGNAIARVYTTGETGKKTEGQKAEANLTQAEQADRDMLVPRKYQEALAENASKPVVSYGPSKSSRKHTSHHRKSRGSKKHGTTHHRKSKKSSHRRRK